MTREETQIRAVLNDIARAIRNKDSAAVIALLADDAVSFDLAPPLRLGPSESRDPGGLKDWFGTWKTPIVVDSHDLQVAVGNEIAYAFGLQHMTGSKSDGQQVDLWYRTTFCFRRDNGRWRITHVHNSVPFAMDGSEKALLHLRP